MHKTASEILTARQRTWPLAVGAAVLLLGFLFFSPVDRAQEARVLVTAREMLQTGGNAWLIPRCNGEVRLQKPPLAYWLAAGSFAVFGVHDWSGRLPMALAGWGMLMITHALGRQLLGRRAALLAAGAMLSTYLFYRFARQAETDILAAFFVTAAIAALIQGWLASEAPAAPRRMRPVHWHLLSGVAMGLAVLAKGPPAIFVLLMAAALPLAVRRAKPAMEWLRSGALLLALAIAAPWFAYILLDPHARVLHREASVMLSGQNHGEPVYMHLVYLLKGLLPWTPFFILALVAGVPRARHSLKLRLLLAWTLVILVPLSILPQKQEHYLMPILPPVMLLIGWALDRSLSGRDRPLAVAAAWTLGIATLVGLLAALVPPLVGHSLRGRVTTLDLAMASLILAALTWALAQARRGLREGLPATMCATAIVTAGLLGVWSPSLVPDDFREIAARVRVYGEDDLVMYDRSILPLSFYLQRVIPVCRTEEELRRSLQANPDIAVVTEAEDEQKPGGLAPPPLPQQLHFERGDEDLVVRSVAPPPPPKRHR